MRRILMHGGLLIAVAFLGGCAAGNKPPQSSLVASPQGVTCSKCQTTWVKVPIDAGKNRIVGYTAQKRHVCPDCKDAVTNFFTTGKLQHTCKTCGEALEVCEAH